MCVRRKKWECDSYCPGGDCDVRVKGRKWREIARVKVGAEDAYLALLSVFRCMKREWEC